MYVKKNILFCFFLGFVLVQGQNKKSKGDGHFFAYAYQDAIEAYENDLEKGYTLSYVQKLNLADSYFKTKDFDKATDIYLNLFEQDSVLGDYHLNMMLQSLGKARGQSKVNDFLSNEELGFSKELQENVSFNMELINSRNSDGELDFKVFNIEGNSPQSDFSPAFYRSNLLFTSGRPLDKRANYRPTGEAYLNIFEGLISNEGQVNSSSVFGDIKDSDYHKATPYFSEELNSVFYVLSNTFEGELEFDENGKNALGIGMQRLGGDFKFLWRDLSTSFYYPFYDHDTSRLYFAANLDDGYGGTDIYYVNTNRGQVMSAPINLGPTVNTPGNEIAPFLFEGTLYFSSDVFYGLGGMDIYKSNLDANLKFSIPVNLGNQINSAKDDFGFIIRNEGDGLLGYFSSNREGGKGSDDIYGFLVDEKPGIKTLALSGKIERKYSNDPIEGVSIILETPDGEPLKEVFSDDKGNYRIEVPWQEQAVLSITKDKFSSFRQGYDAQALEQLQKNPWKITLTAYEDVVETKEDQKVIKLKKFYFDKGMSRITPDISIQLDRVVEVVKAFPAMELRIETHTDSRGGGATNFRLSQARSNAIKKYLMDKGVPASNILYTIGYGEDKLLNQCKNGVFCLELQHRENQRSLIVILNDNILFD
jgi:outer membrane protein OmpA-like peptidoglycan-associated protein